MTPILLILAVVGLAVLGSVLMAGPGTQAYGASTGEPIRVSADGFPEYAVGGITIDWTHANTPVAGAGGVTLADGTFVPQGKHYVRYGAIVRVPVAGGKRGKAIPAVAADGATLERDRTFVLNETVVEDQVMSDNAGGPLNGGRVFRSRLQVAGAFPTEAQLLAVCPRLQLIED